MTSRSITLRNLTSEHLGELQEPFDSFEERLVIPRFIPHTKPTPPDQDANKFRTNPTSPDQSDRLLPPHNPSVVGSIPTGPTNCPTNESKECSLRVL
jgi:hypothetical protein